MIVKIRVPLDQYAFIEIDSEVANQDEALQIYRDTLYQFNNKGVGLGKEWSKTVDNYLTDGILRAEAWEQMNEREQWFIKQWDLYLSRLDYKNNK